MNYATPTRLHDYQYLGADFRERERIRRKHLRLKKRILDLPIYEKNYLIDELLKHGDHPMQTQSGIGETELQGGR